MRKKRHKAPRHPSIFAIDTNIVRHLFEGKKGKSTNLTISNADSHITSILGQCHRRKDFQLLVDFGDQIIKEYKRKIKDEKRKLVRRFKPNIPEIQLLTWFIKTFQRKESLCQIKVNYSDSLMGGIMNLQVSGVDAVFVYVAFQKRTWLLTNDYKDIIDGPQGSPGERRKALMRLATQRQGAKILTSKEAAREMGLNP